MRKESYDDFNWDIYSDGYTGGSKLVPNKRISGADQKNKCFSREPYAQQLFDVYTNQKSELIKKDLISLKMLVCQYRN